MKAANRRNYLVLSETCVKLRVQVPLVEWERGGRAEGAGPCARKPSRQAGLGISPSGRSGRRARPAGSHQRGVASAAWGYQAVQCATDSVVERPPRSSESSFPRVRHTGASLAHNGVSSTLHRVWYERARQAGTHTAEFGSTRYYSCTVYYKCSTSEFFFHCICCGKGLE